MGSFVTLKVRLGPMVSLEFTGESCAKISEALDGYGHLNEQLEDLCSDLARKVYPAEGVENPDDAKEEQPE
jgi:hypothetical protein